MYVKRRKEDSVDLLAPGRKTPSLYTTFDPPLGKVFMQVWSHEV